MKNENDFEVARLAAISVLLKAGLSAGEAADALGRSMTGPAYWRTLVERGEEHIFVCVERYKGGPVTSEVHCRMKDVEQFLTEPSEGCRLGEEEAELPPVNRAFFDVGPAILAALRALHK
jgi:hypothetical protein